MSSNHIHGLAKPVHGALRGIIATWPNCTEYLLCQVNANRPELNGYMVVLGGLQPWPTYPSDVDAARDNAGSPNLTSRHPGAVSLPRVIMW